MSNSKLWIAMVVVTIIAVGGYVFPQVKDIFGAVGTRFPNGLAVGTTATVTQNKLTIGNSGTAIGNLIYGSCALIYSDSSVTASTTKAMDCAVTGVVEGDAVFVQTATTTANGAGWLITGASASSTAGYITLRVANNSGATGNVPRNIASGTPYLIVK